MQTEELAEGLNDAMRKGPPTLSVIAAGAYCVSFSTERPVALAVALYCACMLLFYFSIRYIGRMDFMLPSDDPEFFEVTKRRLMAQFRLLITSTLVSQILLRPGILGFAVMMTVNSAVAAFGFGYVFKNRSRLCQDHAFHTLLPLAFLNLSLAPPG